MKKRRVKRTSLEQDISRLDRQKKETHQTMKYETREPPCCLYRRAKGMFYFTPDIHTERLLLKELLFLQRGRGSLELLLKFLSLFCGGPVALEG
jgi:hypothetical protein